MTQKTQIEIENVSKSYVALKVIPNLSATLEGGAFTVILGPSGCGKSTLLNMLAGLESVSGGKILFDGREVQDMPAKDRGCAMVFQNYALYPHMSVAENMGYALKIARVSKPERMQRIKQVAEIVGLDNLLERRPGQLSGGQRQRVAIARAIVREPQVLLFDEPLSNLDAKLRHEMRMELSSLHKRIGSTSVFVTHDQIEAMTLADSILILKAGEIEQYATPHEIYHKPASAFVAGFIGTPAMNLINVSGSDGALHLSNGEKIVHHAHQGPAIMGIRPENILFQENGVPGKIVYREDLGSHAVVLVRLDSGEEVNVSTPHGQYHPDVSEVCLGISEQDIHLFDSNNQRRL